MLRIFSGVMIILYIRVQLPSLFIYRCLLSYISSLFFWALKLAQVLPIFKKISFLDPQPDRNLLGYLPFFFQPITIWSLSFDTFQFCLDLTAIFDTSSPSLKVPPWFAWTLNTLDFSFYVSCSSDYISSSLNVVPKVESPRSFLSAHKVKTIFKHWDVTCHFYCVGICIWTLLLRL